MRDYITIVITGHGRQQLSPATGHNANLTFIYIYLYNNRQVYNTDRDEYERHIHRKGSLKSNI